jgi:hypothetical protein
MKFDSTSDLRKAKANIDREDLLFYLALNGGTVPEPTGAAGAEKPRPFCQGRGLESLED